MKIVTVTAAAFALSLSLGAAQAGPDSSSTVDVKTHERRGTSPGTVGAMALVSQGIATNPSDVKQQQDGNYLNANGDAKGQRMTEHSPGTVGASPGFTSANQR